MKHRSRVFRLMTVKTHAERRLGRLTDKIVEVGIPHFVNMYAPAVYREAVRVKRMRSAIRSELDRREAEGANRARRIRE